MTFTRDQVISEGVLEIGAVRSLVYVRTNERLRIMHASWLPRRELDAYAVKMIAHRLEQGEPLAAMVSDFQVGTPVLTAALRAHGFEPSLLAWNAFSRAGFKSKRTRNAP